MNLQLIKYNHNASLLIMGGNFPHILDLFQGLKIGVPRGCLGGNLYFKNDN